MGTRPRLGPSSRLHHLLEAESRRSSPDRVTVRFDALAGQQTDIEFVHRGWEALGDAAAEARGNYDEGWDEVLAAFTAVLVG